MLGKVSLGDGAGRAILPRWITRLTIHRPEGKTSSANLLSRLLPCQPFAGRCPGELQQVFRGQFYLQATLPSTDEAPRPFAPSCRPRRRRAEPW